MFVAFNNSTGLHDGGKEKDQVLVTTVGILGSIVFVFAVVAVYKCWQKRKRELDQARFLKLFDDNDDIEEALELSTITL